MVLLGDVHKHQYLKPHIAYSGSFIQQNFGESLDNHGVLVWDIKTRKSTFYEIKNRYGFINISVDNEKWELPKVIPEKPYVRVVLKNTDDSFVDIIKQELERYDVQMFKTLRITEEKEIVMLEHQNDLEILKEELKDDDRVDEILKLHNRLKLECEEKNNE